MPGILDWEVWGYTGRSFTISWNSIRLMTAVIWSRMTCLPLMCTYLTLT